MRFLGNIEAKTDAKGRAFLPAVFRRMLPVADEGVLVLRRDVFQRCLVLYPEAVWNAQTDALRARLSRWNAAHQQLFRQFVSEAETVTLDSNGRFLISRRLMQAVGIEQDIRFIGMDDTIEIWPCTPGEEPQFVDDDVFGKTLGTLMDNGSEPA